MTEKNVKMVEIKKYEGGKYTADNYIRPEIMPNDFINPTELKKRLKYYDIVYDAIHLSSGTHIQYIELYEGNYRYKSGGIIITNKYPDYIVLSNGRSSWSVQLKNNIIFKQKSIQDIITIYENIIYKKNMTIDELKYKIKMLGKQ